MQKGKKALITSWDDGSAEDLKLAEMLYSYRIPAIFYIPIQNPERKVMAKKDIREIARIFEVGSHTFSHVDLTKLSLQEVWEEVRKGKEVLEDIIGKKVDKFCYPKGHYNKKIEAVVKRCGFKEARSARIIFMGESKGFTNNPNLHAFHHSIVVFLAHCVKNGDLHTLSKVCRIYDNNLLNISKKIYQYTSGLHLWGHSWEIKKYNLYPELKKIFEFFSGT